MTNELRRVKRAGEAWETVAEDESGDGGSQPGGWREIVTVVTAADIADGYDTDNGWNDVELFTPEAGAKIHAAYAYKTVEWDGGIASCGAALGSATDFPFDDSTPATLSGGWTVGWNFDPTQGLIAGTKFLQVPSESIFQPSSPFGNVGGNFSSWAPILVETPEPILCRFCMPDDGSTGPFPAPSEGSVTIVVLVADPQ